MRTFWVPLFAALVLSTACDKTVVTPPGTTVLEFESGPNLSVTGWTIGKPAKDAEHRERKFLYEAGQLGSPMRFTLATDTGPVPFTSAQGKPDAPATILAPHKVKVTVTENKGWAVSGKCDPELAVPLAVNPDGTSAYPSNVWARCRLSLTRKNGDISVSIHFDVMGTGELDVGAAGSGQKVTEE